MLKGFTEAGFYNIQEVAYMNHYDRETPCLYQEHLYYDNFDNPKLTFHTHVVTAINKQPYNHALSISETCIIDPSSYHKWL